jgi:phasin
MTEQQFKLEVPTQIKEVAEKTIDQAEQGFSAFIEAATKSVSMVPNPATDVSLKALSLTEQNMKAAFDHAKKLLHANDLQEAMRLQAEFLKAQYEAATEQLKAMGNSVRSSGADVVKKSVEIK